MRVIRFSVEGLVNSYRVPFFRNYHKTFLAPPKTTIIGMLVNIMRESEGKYYNILEDNSIKVSVLIESIEGRLKDLWAYKVLEDSNNGRSVIRRDKLYKPVYTIYLKIEDQDLFENVLDSLKSPKSIPSLGLDDEIVKIFDIETRELSNNNSNIINSVFMDENYKYKYIVLDNSLTIETPSCNLIATYFKIELDDRGARQVRTPKNELRQVEYINCEIEVEDIQSYIDSETGKKVVFY